MSPGGKLDRVSELEASLAELRRLDELRNEFVALVSHELRAPIAVVHGIAATLHVRGDEIAPDQRRELRRMLFDHTGRLAVLVEQLLDLSRLDAGAFDVEPERFRPRERIEELLAQIAPDRLSDVHVEVEPDFELVTDPHGFERVLSNLITNALRYGEPPVEVHAEPNDHVELVVEDRGPGIPPEFVPRIFDRFSQAHRSRLDQDRKSVV